MTKGYQGGKLVSTPATKTVVGHSSEALFLKKSLQIIESGALSKRLLESHRRDDT